MHLFICNYNGQMVIRLREQYCLKKIRPGAIVNRYTCTLKYSTRHINFKCYDVLKKSMLELIEKKTSTPLANIHTVIHVSYPPPLFF